MRIILKSILNRLMQNPTKSLISLISITFGTLLITLCLNVNFKLINMMNSNKENQFVNVLSGKKISKWDIDWDGQELYTKDVIQRLDELPEVEVVSTVDGASNTFNYGEDKYKTRLSIRSDNKILEVLDLEMQEGNSFTGEYDKDAIISSDLAKELFHNENAIGQKIQFPEAIWTEVSEDDWQQTGENIVDYTICGVFKSPDMYNRSTKGTPEIIYRLPENEVYGTLTMKVNSENIESTMKTIESNILDVLGKERNIVVWKGNIDYYESNNSQDFEQTINMFLVFFSILAGISLLIASFSIFSITMISIVERSREIGLKRALGCNKLNVLHMFFIESIFIVLIGVIPGLILSTLFTPSTILGVFPAITGGFIDLTKGLNLSTEPLAMLISFGAMLVAGAILGTFPVLTSVNTHPIEAIKEN